MIQRPLSIFSAASLFATIMLVVGPIPARAADAAPAEPVQAGSYELEPIHTRVLWGVSHFGFSTYYGEFLKTSGSLTLAASDPAASQLEVTIDTASVSVPNDKLEGELKGAQWLDATKFPLISFRSTKVTPTGADSATVVGDLTLHGVTHPVTMTAHFNRGGVNPIDKKYTVGFEVSGQVKRTDFGVSTYAPYIGDQVMLTISAAFEKQG